MSLAQSNRARRAGGASHDKPSRLLFLQCHPCAASHPIAFLPVYAPCVCMCARACVRTQVPAAVCAQDAHRADGAGSLPGGQPAAGGPPPPVVRRPRHPHGPAPGARRAAPDGEMQRALRRPGNMVCIRMVCAPCATLAAMPFLLFGWRPRSPVMRCACAEGCLQCWRGVRWQYLCRVHTRLCCITHSQHGMR